MATYDEATAIDVDGERIEGTFVAVRTQVPGVLFVHGWGGSQQKYLARARAIAALGCVCLTFDLRGHAQTKSRFETVSREDNLRDVVAAFDALAQHPGVDSNAMAVVGSSYGGYLAAILTSLRRIKWLALRAPALYKDSDWALPKWQLKKLHDLDAYRLLRVQPENSRALAACMTFEGDVLIVESEHDFVVPHPVIENYREACSRARSVTYRVIEGADHGLIDEPMQRAYTMLLVEWLRRMLTEQAVAASPAPALVQTSS
jgi:pimeloyl-ACP methyl ester carboxylesterase